MEVRGSRKLFLVSKYNADADKTWDPVNWVEPRLVGPDGEFKLTDIHWTNATSTWGESFINKNAWNKEMRIKGKPVSYGIGTADRSIVEFDLPRGYTHFKTFAALDDVTDKNTPGVRFLVFTKAPYEMQELPKMRIQLSELGCFGTCQVRDLWQKRDMGEFCGDFVTQIQWHSGSLYRLRVSK